MPRSSSNQKVANSLVAMSSAAVLAVYSAGYVRTRPAADRIAKQALERTLARQVPPVGAAPDDPSEKIGREEGLGIATAPLPPAAAIPKRTTVVAPKPAAPSTPANAAIHVPSTGAAPVPAETPEPVSTPASTAVTSLVPLVSEQPAPPPPAPKVWKDGRYIGWGGSRHGDIQATVVIESGRIVSAEITDCQTRYPCDVIEKLPAQVITRQSPNVQRVSGATESADAFYSAVYFALKQAQ